MATLPGAFQPGTDFDGGLFRGNAAQHHATGPATQLGQSAQFRGNAGGFIRPGDAAIVVLASFEMRANDGNCPGTIRYWVVDTEADLDGSEYMGTFCGGSPNLQDIHVALSWFKPVS